MRQFHSHPEVAEKSDCDTVRPTMCFVSLAKQTRLILAVGLGLIGGNGLGWGSTPPPADGIRDETRALTKTLHQQLADELKSFREDLKCDAWITAFSFAPAGITVRRQAQLVRAEWSGQRPAVLMAYDRSTNSSAMSFAPAFWDRYPAAELVEIMQDTRRTLTDTKLTLDERLALATRHWIDRLRVMESIRLKQTLWLPPGEKRQALILAVSLAAASVLGAILGFASRLRDARVGRRFRFPEVHVGMRFGAPYGGGVTAEIKAHANAQ